jgi:hypothetical protein
MRSTPFLATLALLCHAGVGSAQAPAVPVPLAASLLPLPEALRAEAGVRVFSAAGVSVVRPSTNGLMCTADRPEDDLFDVRCYHETFLAVMDFARSLRAKGVPDAELDTRLREAAQQGLIQLPASPTAGYRMLGPISGFDPAQNITTTAIDKWQSVHFPFRTAAELGLPTDRDGTMPFVMDSGTWWSHVMIVHSTARTP